MRGLYGYVNDYTSSYDELLSKQDSANIHIRNIQQLMTEISKCLKGISPRIMSIKSKRLDQFQNSNLD